MASRLDNGTFERIFPSHITPDPAGEFKENEQERFRVFVPPDYFGGYAPTLFGCPLNGGNASANFARIDHARKKGAALRSSFQDSDG
jgi:hypothetical protein